MCGLAGEYRWDGRSADVEGVVRMTGTLHPNDVGTTLGPNALWQVALLEMWLQEVGA